MIRLSAWLPAALLLYFPFALRAQTFHLKGLQQPVEVWRDSSGVNHIFAGGEHDLFFTQGYCAARDRLFQFELWRRQATGTVAEILGPRELTRDIGARLFKFRGSHQQELAHYHIHGRAIIEAFVEGVNTYIDECLLHPEQLPVEFKMLHILPGKWTWETVVSRHMGLLGNATEELNYGMAVARVGAEKVKELSWFHPKDPVLTLDSAIDGSLLTADILTLYTACHQEVRFDPSDIDPAYRDAPLTDRTPHQQEKDEPPVEGSNNWVVSGAKTYNGYTMLANDPHRRISVPSLRYMVHLVAPGWNVIGGGEPEIPGVSIGHNEYGAWGLTIFETDGEDIYVYDLNPADLHQYRYERQWVAMKAIQERIAVKDHSDTLVTLYYTQHGPVTYIDEAHHKAYALKCAWLEPGGSPYLASLRIDQSENWEQFREACSYSNIPGENMVWADKKGHIGWQAVGIAPIRPHFSGLVPIPGDGRYEWAGYLPIKEKPHAYNSPQGFFTTANQNVTPPDYTHWDAIGYVWANDFRADRIRSVLASKPKLTIQDFESLQTDYYSIPASQLVPLLKGAAFKDASTGAVANELLQWNYVLDKNSIPAAIYIAWERKLKAAAYARWVPPSLAQQYLITLSWQRVLDWLLHPEKTFGYGAAGQRNAFLVNALEGAIAELTGRLGPDTSRWQYGQQKYKHVTIVHPLGTVVGQSWKRQLNTGPLPRGGDGDVPGSTGEGDNQISGASFRIIVNTGDWDAAVGINTPGQSGDPSSPYYSNLFTRWANDRYFPLYYSRKKIRRVRAERLLLMP